MAIYNQQLKATSVNTVATAFNSTSAVILYPAVSGNNANITFVYNSSELGFPATSGSSAVNVVTTWGDTVKLLVYSNGTRQAFATTALSAGTTSVSAVTVSANGFGYRTAPTLTFSAPQSGTNAASATANLDTTTGAVTGFTITNAGSGYSSAPSVTIAAPNDSTVSFLIENPNTREQNVVTITYNNVRAATGMTVTYADRSNSTPESRRKRLLGYI